MDVFGKHIFRIRQQEPLILRVYHIAMQETSLSCMKYAMAPCRHLLLPL